MKLTRARMGLVVLAVVAASLVGVHVTPAAAEVYAHANLARSAPAPNSTLDSPPNQVVVWFTEPVEPKFSEIQILDVSQAPEWTGTTASWTGTTPQPSRSH